MPFPGRSSLLWSLVCAAWMIAILVQGQQSQQPEVMTKYGQLKGKQVTVKGTDRLANVFLGIPFAKPPVGALRFSPPQPAEPWISVRDATSFPPMPHHYECGNPVECDWRTYRLLHRCPPRRNATREAQMKLSFSLRFLDRRFYTRALKCLQDQTILEKFEEIFPNKQLNFSISEDCLYLNIYTPAHFDERIKLPVMVWIHGGGFLMGGASMFDGSALCAYENVVVVTIQYRLGIPGFFSTGDEHAQGNWGFWDQVAALQWIQKNIKHFGGDPGSVTIFGESAGGISVSVLVLSPLAKGLFQKATSESGVALLSAMFSSHLEEIAKMVANISGCDTSSSAAMVHCLRKKPEEEMILSSQLQQQIAIMPAVIDGVILPKNPEELMAGKEFNSVPYIIGVNNHEYGWMLPYSSNIPGLKEGMHKETVLSTLQMMHPLLSVSAEFVPLVIDEYLGDTDDPVALRDQFLDLIGDTIFLVPAIKTSNYHRDSGSPVYFYEFQHRPSSASFKPDFVKADHGDELSFVFGGAFLTDETSLFASRDATEEEKHLSKTIMKYWANFARNGNPNGEGLVEWPAYDVNEQYLQLNLQQQKAKKLKRKRVEFWTKTLPEKIRIMKEKKEHAEL